MPSLEMDLGARRELLVLVERVGIVKAARSVVVRRGGERVAEVEGVDVVVEDVDAAGHNSRLCRARWLLGGRRGGTVYGSILSTVFAIKIIS